MNYLSVCSGIEAATVAWHDLGWKPAGFSEIESFPSAVLQHHYPEVTNFGDMTKFKEWNLEPNDVDLLVGGTPCQSFSVAGLRKGLDDPRGNLALTYCSMLDHFRPTWFIWENVPGVLSSSGGRDFGSFLGAVAQLGYWFAYRVLDAQYFGVAQRRRRVFVVGHLGSWQRAAAVLFERQSLCRDTAPSREKGKETAGSPIQCFDRQSSGEYGTAPVASTMSARDYKSPSDLVSYGIPGNWIGRKPENGGNAVEPMHDVSPCLTKTDRHGVAQPMPINTMIALRHNALGEGTGFGIGEPGDPAYTLIKGHSHAVAHPISFDLAQITSATNRTRAEPGLPASTMAKGSSMHVAHPIAFNARQDPDSWVERTGTLDTDGSTQAVAQSMAVRRLTPVECERLQGFPDNYTNIPWRKSEESPDGPRYKALGNSMAVPVMRWIGERIKMVDELCN